MVRTRVVKCVQWTKQKNFGDTPRMTPNLKYFLRESELLDSLGGRQCVDHVPELGSTEIEVSDT